MPERPTSWQTFLRTHWGVIAGADFFETEVWTLRGLVTYYTVFVTDLASRRVQIIGSTPFPNDLFMHQVGRTLTAAAEGILGAHRVLICDRDAKWSALVRAQLGEAGIRVVQTPYQAPNANAYAERLVRSIKHECLNQVTRSVNVISDGRLPSSSRTITERNHQGLDNELIDRVPALEHVGRIRRRQRLGGPLNYYYRAA